MKNFPIYTFVLIVFCFLVFVFEFFLPLDLFVFVPSLAFYRPWTFVTSIFLHANFSHLFFNMFALFIFGTCLETRIKSKKYIIIFFLAGIVGNFGYMFSATNPNIPGVGASGAIYGIMGTLTILEPFMIVYTGGMPMPLIVAAVMWATVDLLGFFTPSDIAHAAHIAGLFIGILFGFYIKTKIKKRSRRL